MTEPSGRLYVYNGGFLTQRRVRRILHLAGFDLRLGLPSDNDTVAVWGQSPTAHRGERVARNRKVPLVRIEDAFLRSLLPGRTGEPPLGLLIDRSGVHFDPSVPSDLEILLATDPLDDTAVLNRARTAIARLRDLHLTKYSACRPDIAVPDPGYVLVVDQTRDDAAVRTSGADDARFREMLVFAQEEHPGARVVIKTHPETAHGLRPGYFSHANANDRISLLTDPVSPWHLLDGAVGVYTVSSQLGFEAILAGHKPRIFGQPFYAGWGLTEDDRPVPRRSRQLTRAQLFAAAMILYPTWYDPYRDQLCQLEQVIDTLDTQTRAWREDHRGWDASGMRLWKRKPLQQMFGKYKRLRFSDGNSPVDDRPRMAWASKAKDATPGVVRVEDGFLRSRGLGAELVPPLSLVLDRQGIYYDPANPSDLETWIGRRETLRPDQAYRADSLIEALTRNALSKYNVGGRAPEIPTGHRVLVVGQVEDDASVRLGASQIQDNLALLRAAREARPDAVLIYKPHPDVEAGLRLGAVSDAAIADLTAVTVPGTNPAHLIPAIDEVWTMTSLLGFEALIRGCKTVTVGAPFYAGWGLTTDLGDLPKRRSARPDLAGLVHAALIDYPRYWDPVTRLPCPVEVVVERLASRDLPRRGPVNRSLSKLQGLLATATPFWR
ncbi:MAG: capsular polysaccharide biosynthesis protein [Pseudomonadota bacterium]